MSMEPEDKTHVTIVMPRRLYERLNNMRWETHAQSFAGMLRDQLEQCVDRYEEEREKTVR